MLKESEQIGKKGTKGDSGPVHQSIDDILHVRKCVNR